MARKGHVPEERLSSLEIPGTAFLRAAKKWQPQYFPGRRPQSYSDRTGHCGSATCQGGALRQRFWPSACTSAVHEAQLSHLGTREGLLRRLWKLAEPLAYAGGASRVVLLALLPCLQSTAGFPASTSANRTDRPRIASGVGAPEGSGCPYLGRIPGSRCESP
jgi:hypothetical protein